MPQIVSFAHGSIRMIEKLKQKLANPILALIILPLGIGLVLALVSYILPIIFGAKKELTYRVWGTEKPALDSTSVPNKGQIGSLYIHEVHLWNSGSKPIKDLVVTILFESGSDNFQIVAERHVTKPEHGFGDIKEETVSAHSVKYIYQLLNPKDEEQITFLTSSPASLKFYAKAEELKVKEGPPPTNESWIKSWLPTIGAIASFMTLALQILLTHKRRRRMQEQPQSKE
jgi:hypothetical protein